MVALVSFIIHGLALGALILALHGLSPRVGFAPLLIVVGGLTMLLQSQLGLYTDIIPGARLYFSQFVLLPAILAAVLVVYVANGAVPARIMIYCILLVTILLVIISYSYRFTLLMLGSASASPVPLGTIMNFLNFSPGVLIASLVAFLADMVTIAVVYQGMRNYLPKVSEVFAIGVALIAALWVDALVISLIFHLPQGIFAERLPGNVLGKTMAGLTLWLPVALYLTRFARHQTDYLGGENRPLLDLLFGSPQSIKKTLVRTQQALENSEFQRQREAEYFRQISEHVDDGLWMAQPFEVVPFFVNAAYEAIWGRDSAAMTGDRLAFVNSLHPEDRDRVLAHLPMQAKGNYDVEYRIQRPDGEVRWIRDRAFPVFDSQGNVSRIVGIATDITSDRLRHAEQMELAVEKERVRLLRDFIAEVTHDLKTPLSAINLKLHQVLRATDESARRQLLQEAKAQSARMGKMVSDMLTLSRLESLSDMTLIRVNLRELMNEACQQSAVIAREKQVDVRVQADAPVSDVLADRDDLLRALANLVENAIYYTPGGGQVSINLSDSNGTVVVRIADTGIGINPLDLPHVFERFYRAANARAADPAGTGLGLVIVKKVIEQHRGRIEVESCVGQGTTFTLYLPRILNGG
ncbi:MAG: ATP-binding protein [Chloroflexota bacterium]|nr:ATP-binding protein [Chloroflexota bacterium]